jgi:hypothetical protein
MPLNILGLGPSAPGLQRANTIGNEMGKLRSNSNNTRQIVVSHDIILFKYDIEQQIWLEE